MNTPPVISIENVHKHFGHKKVLQGVNLTIQPGESCVIIGGSGTGKSVLLKSILGLVTPDSGTITVNGQVMETLHAREHEVFMQQFGMLFQGGALFDSLSVWENITFAVRRRDKLSKDAAISLAQAKLKAVGLRDDVAFQIPAELSGGMQKRVALARAICGNPAIIFFDEPTTGLDPIMADVINELIIQCCKDLGATAVTITHDMASARKIADRIAMIYDGRIMWEGNADDVMQSGNAYVDQFVHGRAEGPITVNR